VQKGSKEPRGPGGRARSEQEGNRGWTMCADLWEGIGDKARLGEGQGAVQRLGTEP
jgi:hypothetical protein